MGARNGTETASDYAMRLAVKGSSLNTGVLNATTLALSAYVADVLSSSGQVAELLNDDFPFPTLNASQVKPVSRSTCSAPLAGGT